MEWAKLDHVVIAAAIRQGHCRQLQISDTCFVHLLLQYFPHNDVIKLDSNLANFEATAEVG